jgi:branched-chain amino acid transport system substrate-binding protein
MLSPFEEVRMRIIGSGCALAGALALALGATGAGTAQAQGAPPIRIAVETDMSGVLSALSGPTSLRAVQMAVDDAGGSVLGRKIEVVAIDHRNNAGEGAAKAREFWAQGGDLIVDLTNSGVAIAVETVGRELHKLALVTGGYSSDITGKFCSKYTYQYDANSYSLAHATGANLAAQPGGKRWYIVYADYAFGHAMLNDFTHAIVAHGGEILRSDAVPLGTTDFSAYLLAARAAHPQVIATMNTGADLINVMKQIREFGLDRDAKISIGLLSQAEVNALPDLFAGARVTVPWFWNQDRAAIAWTDRLAKYTGTAVRPTEVHAGDYSAVSQWLAAVKATGTTDADTIVAYLDGRKVDDFYVHGGEWRARDHQMVHAMEVVDVVGASAAKLPGANFQLVETIPADRSFPAPADSVCQKTW